ncbi:hypothetical protein BDP27DRAFT_678066 [Rhodocollybia butyracea]|uniref:Secreted protein n=1 Tax=Rhodocollybia butyracea TaxID=206335 RepID=A0A9P5TX37_9AGAR|nr:hypothetical protein BDP27DRAFT_678066 [Rhodocollybia butyracea]
MCEWRVGMVSKMILLPKISILSTLLPPVCFSNGPYRNSSSRRTRSRLEEGVEFASEGGLSLGGRGIQVIKRWYILIRF